MSMRLLMVGAIALVSSSALPQTKFGDRIPKDISQAAKSDSFKLNKNYNLSELEAINRQERQIRFKGTYQELPQGIPQFHSEDNDVTHDSLLSYYIRVEGVDSSVSGTFSTAPKSSSIYFPPEVVEPSLMTGGSGRSNRPTHNLVVEKAESKSQGPSESAKLNYITPYSALDDLLPFYIPTQDVNVDYTEAVTPKKTIFHYKNTSEGSSHSANPPVFSKSFETDGDFYFSTPSSNSEHFLNSKETFPKNALPAKKNSADSFLTVPSFEQPTEISFLDQIADSTTSLPIDTNTPFFIIENKVDLNTPKTNEIPPSTNIIINSKELYSFQPPSRIVAQPNYINTRPKTNSNSHFSKDKRPETRRLNKQRPSKGRRKDSRTLTKTVLSHTGNDSKPTIRTSPKTKFDCSTKAFGGYYSDPDSNCQVFHVCLGRHSAVFQCPTGTLFNQKLLVCDWWYNVECHNGVF